MKIFILTFMMIAFSLYGAEADKEIYRIGDEWGKKPVTAKTLASATPIFVRAAQATAYLPIGGTGFYLGQFNGMHVMATNYHVCPKEYSCKNDNAHFKMLNKKFKTKNFLISLPDIDLALLTLDIPKKDEELMAKVAKNFSFNQDVIYGQQLLTIGFGIAANSSKAMVANQDTDCRVFSETGEYRHMADPDKVQKGYYKAWSFAHGCDLSHGDSGSAIVDRNTGDILGLLWTGRIPKIKEVKKTSFLNTLDASSPEVWKELSYAVPAKKIGEELLNQSENIQLPLETRLLLRELVLSDR